VPKADLRTKVPSFTTVLGENVHFWVEELEKAEVTSFAPELAAGLVT
jgi:hypothetical protein